MFCKSVHILARGQTYSRSLKLEVWTVVSRHVGTEDRTWVLYKSTYRFSTAESSPQIPKRSFILFLNVFGLCI